MIWPGGIKAFGAGRSMQLPAVLVKEQGVFLHLRLLVAGHSCDTWVLQLRAGGVLRGAVALELSWEHGSATVGVHGPGSRSRLPVGPAVPWGTCFSLRGGAAPRAAESSITHSGFIFPFSFYT